jgi:hypothetical protein
MPQLSAFREFLATADMVLVRKLVEAYAEAKLVPGYVKRIPVEWMGSDQVECYLSSAGTIVLEIHRDKTKVDDAKREIPRLEKELYYNRNQAQKIQKEMAEGRIGRKGDFEKFEAKVSELENEIRIKNADIDGAVVDRIEFDVEDCG